MSGESWREERNPLNWELEDLLLHLEHVHGFNRERALMADLGALHSLGHALGRSSPAQVRGSSGEDQ